MSPLPKNDNPIDITQIAQALGVSKTTVSRAISGNGRISAATRQRVLDYVKKHNYTPSMMARGLVKRCSYNISLVISTQFSDFELPFLRKVMRSVYQVAGDSDYDVLLQAGQDGTNWRPTVRPPRLGGNTRMGVFATRSPFRPNALGLSSVKLLKVEPNTPQGPVLTVGGADLLDGTPIFDIKPYLPYVDAHPDARGGFTDTTKFYTLQVQAEPEVLEQVPADKRDALLGVLRSDPRPSYQHDPERLYGLSFGGVEVKFKVDGDVLTVVSTGKLKKNK